MLLSHQPHGFIAEVIRVLNGLDPSLGSVESPRLARRMYCNVLANARSLTNGSAEFAFGVLIGSGELAVVD